MSLATLLTLPPEIRHQIWSTFYTLNESPRIVYRAPYGHSVSIIRQLATSLPSTCRSLHAEVWPVIWANLKLHLTRDHHNTEHTYLYKLLPDWIQNEIQHVSWYLTVDSSYLCPSIPYQPLPLWLFPKLKSLTICHAQSLAAEELPNVGAGIQEVLASEGETVERAWDVVGEKRAEEIEALNQQMTTAQRMAEWWWTGSDDGKWRGLRAVINAMERAESHIRDLRGRGRWIKAIVDPDGRCEESENNSGPVIDMIADQRGEGLDEEDQEEMEQRHVKVKLVEDIVRRVRVEIQLECILTRTVLDGPQSVTDVPVLLVFDLRQRRVVEARELGYEECRSNLALGLSAHDAHGL